MNRTTSAQAKAEGSGNSNATGGNATAKIGDIHIYPPAAATPAPSPSPIRVPEPQKPQYHFAVSRQVIPITVIEIIENGYHECGYDHYHRQHALMVEIVNQSHKEGTLYASNVIAELRSQNDNPISPLVWLEPLYQVDFSPSIPKKLILAAEVTSSGVDWAIPVWDSRIRSIRTHNRLEKGSGPQAMMLTLCSNGKIIHEQEIECYWKADSPLPAIIIKQPLLL